MRMSWNLGRIAGINVFLHPSLLLLLAYFGAMQGGVESILLVAAVFGCVLLHEFGHALTARQFGIETEDITLYPIGGVARLRRLPRAPGAELLITLAGPAVNLAIALALGVALVAGAVVGIWQVLPLAGFVRLLMYVNLVLAAFNLIPAFPMDGGRVLRAALSGWLGRLRATEIAASVGQVLAVLFGVYSLLHGELIHVALAAFIYFAARTELAHVASEEQQRTYANAPHQGIWTAPPGYRWIRRGQGLWQLAPINVSVNDQEPIRWL
ncbi:MAG: site-2 protease family protein [Isosphaeraceae bacterium]|nr:site-2 protease family protein [Isosphaeraceae bacterium]